MSTARHQLAGAPGTGTTIDNMQSRTKVWLSVNQQGVMVVRISFNVSGIQDGGNGITTVTFGAPFSTGEYAGISGAQPVISVLDVWSDVTSKSAINCNCRHYENSTPTDVLALDIIMMGNLA